MLFPAHFDIRGDVLMVPDLHARVSLFGRDNKVIAHLGDDAAWIAEVKKMQIRKDPEALGGRQVRPSARRLLRPRWEYFRRRMGRYRPGDTAEESELSYARILAIRPQCFSATAGLSSSVHVQLSTAGQASSGTRLSGDCTGSVGMLAVLHALRWRSRRRLRRRRGMSRIFPADNPWNTPVDHLKVHPKSEQYIRSIGADKGLHPDFGAPSNGIPSGIPFCFASKGPKTGAGEIRICRRKRSGAVSDSRRCADRRRSEIERRPACADHRSGREEAVIELRGTKSTGDRHVLIVDPEGKKLYELFSTYKTAAGWKAGSGPFSI